MRQKLTACLLGVALVLASGLAVAKEYAVEIIVFDRLEKEQVEKDRLEKVESEKDQSEKDPREKEIHTDEQWNFSSARIAEHLAEMAELADKASEQEFVKDEIAEDEIAEDEPVEDEIVEDETIGYETVDEVFTLEPVRLSLIEAGYRVLNTTSWQQPTSLYKDAPLISLSNTNADTEADTDSEVEADTDTYTEADTDTDADAGAEADPALIAGFVRIYTTALIHADLHLQLSPLPANPDLTDADSVVADAVEYVVADTVEYTEENAAEDADAPPAQPHYFIAEKRRLKFAQIHYFDHPLFGAILGVWEAEEADESDEHIPP